MNYKFASRAKILLTICGIVSILGLLYVFVSFFIQKNLIENSENGWDALGLVLLFIIFSLPNAVLNLALAICSFVFSSRIKKVAQGEKKPPLVLAIVYLILALIAGVLSGIISFSAVYFEPVSLAIGVFQTVVSIVSLACVIKYKKLSGGGNVNASNEIGINE